LHCGVFGIALGPTLSGEITPKLPVIFSDNLKG
jgi:hypothetical protein